MFTQSAAFYDRIYTAIGKDHAAEARALATLIRAALPGATTLLDVGCGTGLHLAEFERQGFACRGVDADINMVTLARGREPELQVDLGDMRTLDLGERFDAVTALFAVLAYARTKDHLLESVARLAVHVKPGGILIAEGFIPFAQFVAGRQTALLIDDADLKICRMSMSRQVGRIAILDFHYLVGTPQRGIERLFERHELGLFEAADYRAAFEAAGLTFVEVDVPEIGFGRQVFVGRRGPASTDSTAGER
jgi:SAM-dependent methyltransferase